MDDGDEEEVVDSNVCACCNDGRSCSSSDGMVRSNSRERLLLFVSLLFSAGEGEEELDASSESRFREDGNKYSIIYCSLVAKAIGRLSTAFAICWNGTFGRTGQTVPVKHKTSLLSHSLKKTMATFRGSKDQCHDCFQCYYSDKQRRHD